MSNDKKMGDRVFIQTPIERIAKLSNDYSDMEDLFQHGTLDLVDLLDNKMLDSLSKEEKKIRIKERKSIFNNFLNHEPNIKSLSIVIPILGRKSILLICIDSILRQSFVRHHPNKIEIIIVRDGFAHNPEDDPISDELLNKIDTTSPEIKFHSLMLKENKGRSTARNVGIHHASNEIVFFIDSSMVLEDEFLTEHMIRHQRIKSAAFLGFKENISFFNYIKSSKEIISNKIKPDYRQDLKWTHILKENETPFNYSGKKYSVNDTINYMKITDNFKNLKGADSIGFRSLATFFQTNLASVSLSDVENVGGFEPMFDSLWGFEDSYIGALLFANGIKIIPCPSALAYKIEHDEDETKAFDIERNRELFKELLSKKYMSSYSRSLLKKRIKVLLEKKIIDEVFDSDDILYPNGNNALGPSFKKNDRNNSFSFIPFDRNWFLCHQETYISKILSYLERDKPDKPSRLTLHGLSGTGKTAMAVEYAYCYNSRYPGGVFIIVAEHSLYPAIRSFFTKIKKIESLSIDIEKSTPDSLIEYFISFFQKRHKSLLILDNVTDLDILPNLHQIKSDIILTSQITNLPFPFISMDTIMDDSTKALDILLSYSQMKNSELTDLQREDAEAVCRILGNLPLALEIAGSIARNSGFKNLRYNLDDFVKKKSHTQHKGNISVEAALDLAEKQFEHPLSKNVLKLISYFDPDDIQPAIINEILKISSKETDDALLGLSKYSLIKGKIDGGYSIHRLVQSSARELDIDNAIGSLFIDWLIEKKNEIWKSGNLKKAGLISKHIIYISLISTADSNIDTFPPEEKVFDLIDFLFRAGYHKQIQDLFSFCIARIKNSGENIPLTLSDRLNSRAMAYWYLGHYEEAERSINIALDYAKSSTCKIDEKIADILCTKGLILKNIDKPELAKASFIDAFEFDKVIINNTLNSLESNHADNVLKLSKLLEIIYSMLEKIIGEEISDEFFIKQFDYISKNYKHGIFNDDTKQTASILREFAKHINNYAVVLREQNEFSLAKPLFEIALCLTEIINGPDDRTTAFHLSNLAIVMNGLRRYKESNDLFQKELKIIEKYYSKRHQAYSIHLQRWGNALTIQCEYKKAIEKYSEAVEIFEEVANYDHPELLNQILSLSKVLELNNKHDKAIEFLSGKYDKFVLNLTDSHPHTIKIQETLDFLTK